MKHNICPGAFIFWFRAKEKIQDSERRVLTVPMHEAVGVTHVLAMPSNVDSVGQEEPDKHCLFRQEGQGGHSFFTVSSRTNHSLEARTGRKRVIREGRGYPRKGDIPVRKGMLWDGRGCPSVWGPSLLIQ